MTRKLQILRGTTAQNNAYTGAVGELTMDTDRNEVRIHDGQTVGGIKISDRNMPILTSMFFDHVVNDMSWLRADTFSWQSGDVYVAAYEHLVDDVFSVARFAWGSGTYLTISETPSVNDPVFERVDGEIILSEYHVSEVASDYSTIKASHNIHTGLSIGPLNRVSQYDNVKTDTIGDITITYYLAEDGHKICLPDQESNIVALYEKIGSADYYILDTTNKQFKLPRKQKRRLIQAVNNADGTWYNLYSDGWVEQGGFDATVFNAKTFTFPMEMKDTGYTLTLGYGYGDIGGQHGKFGITERTTTGFSFSVLSLSGNATGANMSWNVSGYAAESAYASAGMQLEYYYVGNFEQTAIEQTAGITAETLNRKADSDLGNIPTNYDYVVESQLPTSANGYTWYRKYKSGWVEQGGFITSMPSSKYQDVVFPVIMVDISYAPSVTASWSNSATGQNEGVQNQTTTGMRVTTSFATVTVWWQVSGMAAQ